MRNFQDLSVWQRSHQLTLVIYNLTKLFPRDELFGLSSQMRRSSSSIPTNIAEGCGRNSNLEMKRFLVYATGSSSELEYQIILSNDLGYLTNSTHLQLTKEITEIRKMLHAFVQKLSV